jgi:hypothetical protein
MITPDGDVADGAAIDVKVVILLKAPKVVVMGERSEKEGERGKAFWRVKYEEKGRTNGSKPGRTGRQRSDEL